MDPGMFEDKSGPEAHDRAHKGNGYTGPYVVTSRGLSFPGTAILKAILGARRSMKKNPMTKQMGNIKRISDKALGRAL